MKLKKMTIQLYMAVFLCISGMGLLIAGFCVAPVGEIHNSVLIAYGEVMTFVGGLLGMDYTYSYKDRKYNQVKPKGEPTIDNNKNNNNDGC